MNVLTVNDEVTEILRHLKIFTGKFPAEKLKKAPDFKEELTPHLLDFLEFALNNDNVLENSFMGHIYAMFLLAEFRYKKAYPYILKFYRLPEDHLECLLGDIITEGLDQITASICDGDIIPLIEIFEDEDVYEFARIAAFNAILIQLNQGVIKKEGIVQFIDRKLREGIQLQDIWLVTQLGNAIIDYRLESLYDLMRQAFKENIVDPDLYDEEFFEIAIADKDDSLSCRNRHTFIDSTYEELKNWSCFGMKTIPPKNIGRNDSCPCGSEKKFKKCCYLLF